MHYFITLSTLFWCLSNEDNHSEDNKDKNKYNDNEDNNDEYNNKEDGEDNNNKYNDKLDNGEKDNRDKDKDNEDNSMVLKEFKNYIPFSHHLSFGRLKLFQFNLADPSRICILLLFRILI